MRHNKLHDIGLKLLHIVQKDDYTIVIYEAAISVAYSLLAGKFEDDDTIFYHTTKKDNSVGILKKVFKKAGIGVKVKLVKDRKKYPELEYSSNKGCVYRYTLNCRSKCKPVADRFEILDL
jgi:hypothetical protein